MSDRAQRARRGAWLGALTLVSGLLVRSLVAWADEPRLDLAVLIDVSEPVGGDSERHQYQETVGSVIDKLHSRFNGTARIFLFAGKPYEIPDPTDETLRANLRDALTTPRTGPLADVVHSLDPKRTDLIGALKTLKAKVGVPQVPTKGFEPWPALLVISSAIHDPDPRQEPGRSRCPPAKGPQPYEIDELRRVLETWSIRVVFLHTPCGFDVDDSGIFAFKALRKAALDAGARILEASPHRRSDVRAQVEKAFDTLWPDIVLKASGASLQGNGKLVWRLETPHRVDAQLTFCRQGNPWIREPDGDRGLVYGREAWFPDDHPAEDRTQTGCATQRIRARMPIHLSLEIRPEKPMIEKGPGAIRLAVSATSGAVIPSVYPAELTLSFDYAPPPVMAIADWLLEWLPWLLLLFGVASLWLLLALCHAWYGTLACGWRVHGWRYSGRDGSSRVPLKCTVLRGYRCHLEKLGFEVAGNDVVYVWPLGDAKAAVRASRKSAVAKIHGFLAEARKTTRRVTFSREDLGLVVYGRDGRALGTIVFEWEPESRVAALTAAIFGAGLGRWVTRWCLYCALPVVWALAWLGMSRHGWLEYDHYRVLVPNDVGLLAVVLLPLILVLIRYDLLHWVERGWVLLNHCWHAVRSLWS